MPAFFDPRFRFVSFRPAPPRPAPPLAASHRIASHHIASHRTLPTATHTPFLAALVDLDAFAETGLDDRYTFIVADVVTCAEVGIGRCAPWTGEARS